MKARRKRAAVRVELTAVESSVLVSLCEDLSAMLDAADSDDPAFQRLHPDGYTDDDAASAEFRELVMDGLATDRAARLAAFRASMPIGGGRIELDAEAADQWIRVLNDLRLALGTRLGVTEDAELDQADEAVNLYNWLTAVQETLVQSLG